MRTINSLYIRCLLLQNIMTKNITNGMDETHFGPDSPCIRGQIVTFLYRDLAK